MNLEQKRDLSNAEISAIVNGLADELRKGYMSRAQFRRELVAILTDENGVIVRNKALDSRGRLSFGRPNGGKEGIALFVPEEQLDD